jgi:hypothetical protein
MGKIKKSLKMSIACFGNMINDELISPDADFVDDLVKRRMVFQSIFDYMEELECTPGRRSAEEGE